MPARTIMYQIGAKCKKCGDTVFSNNSADVEQCDCESVTVVVQRGMNTTAADVDIQGEEYEVVNRLIDANALFNRYRPEKERVKK